ncbi:DEAD/DEAH box helicase [Streptomyces sp. NPDC058045]|uniref:DEAD/DEAH box helicase n=1 Tax=Streptomyces sp. NPDC058045 TaxID=3346311 RepID=UPI0036EA30A7
MEAETTGMVGVRMEHGQPAQDEPAPDTAAPTGRRAAVLLEQAGELLTAARGVRDEDEAARDAVREAVAGLEQRLARAELERLPLPRLNEVTAGHLREETLRALELGGYSTVGQVLAAGTYPLRALPGIGAATAGQLMAAAEQLARAAVDGVAVRIDMDAATTGEPLSTALLLSLNRMLLAGPGIDAAVRLARRTAEEIEADLDAARPAASRLRLFFSGRRRRAAARSAAARLAAVLERAERDEVLLALRQAAVDLLRGPLPVDQAWLDFEVRAADYYTLLPRITDRVVDRASAEGFLPVGAAEEIRAQPLDESLLRVELRGYQAFGARFALARRRVLIGDEMGLGKTVQAIAALTHLAAAEQGRHFLVVCPAGVLLNWIREIGRRSALTAHRLHGPDRATALNAWRRQGGVAVTSFDVLRNLTLPEGVGLEMLVVDEAHYVKNHSTQRARAVDTLVRRRSTGRVLFLTGTPMQSRPEEFRALVRYLRPRSLPEPTTGVRAEDSRVFRARVADCYLRRNQPDVLTELPGVLHTDAWEEFSEADQAAYRQAVEGRDFAAMRRAAYADPAQSAKLRRLKEVVAEAAENGLKVVVFSAFREVLGTVSAALAAAGGPPVSEALTGGVPLERRQELIDEFTATEGPAVLPAQIQTGGLGINLQAASVVVLCEPQLTPALEAQAIGRTQRMGQVRRVQVHRLLATGSVDQRLVEVLAERQKSFDAYARRSELAESDPQAVDISHAALARRIVEDEQLRLALTGADVPEEA